ncbi:MAG: hypothetical protein IKI18_01865 [Prevotella sp.]|nr:hypothetical protein [Prevotella sp.]
MQYETTRSKSYRPIPAAPCPAVYRDEDGFHILTTTTQGERWVPQKFAYLKSFINGERVYRKNRPKK